MHRQVERSGLMRRILAGDFGHADYVALLHDLAALYGTLEAALSAACQPPLAGDGDRPRAVPRGGRCAATCRPCRRPCARRPYAGHRRPT
ncbi:MAG: hypothetical protein MZW92_69790 [Comamonadaceae bacterium]|nr:hypothetical protein [Comamonadaceae bacterium]